MKKLSNQAILEKAIQKAIDGGWLPLKSMQGNRVLVQQWRDDGMVEVGIVNDSKPEDVLTWVRELEGIIFNHDFARALWGEKDIKNESGDVYILPLFVGSGKLSTAKPWQYHLQQMVIADDPIKYLGEHLDG